MIVALLNQTGGFGNTTTALRLSGKWARLGLRDIVIDADSQSQIENCWLDLSKQRAKEGLPKSLSLSASPVTRCIVGHQRSSSPSITSSSLDRHGSLR